MFKNMFYVVQHVDSSLFAKDFVYFCKSYC